MTNLLPKFWISAADVLAEGYCLSGVSAWVLKEAVLAGDPRQWPGVREIQVTARLDGDGNGHGNGYGDGYGDGYGYGYGYGGGYGDGHGYGYGYGYGGGDGFCNEED